MDTTNTTCFSWTFFSHTINNKGPLNIVNNCGFYLQIFTLVDITSTDGTRITECSTIGQRNPSFHSLLHWTKQKIPSIKTWKAFTQIIKSSFCHLNSLKLLKPLGPWKPTKYNYKNGTISMTPNQNTYTNTTAENIAYGHSVDQ